MTNGADGDLLSVIRANGLLVPITAGWRPASQKGDVLLLVSG